MGTQIAAKALISDVSASERERDMTEAEEKELSEAVCVLTVLLQNTTTNLLWKYGGMLVFGVDLISNGIALAFDGYYLPRLCELTPSTYESTPPVYTLLLDAQGVLGMPQDSLYLRQYIHDPQRGSLIARKSIDAFRLYRDSDPERAVSF